jgi:hypothetical protein
MTSFDYFKHKFKKLKFAWQHFETQSSIKINFNPMIKWRGFGSNRYT